VNESRFISLGELPFVPEGQNYSRSREQRRAMEEGLCYFHANPDKASELGKRGGRAKGSMGTPGASEYVAPNQER
jgi:hypothetical protein